MKYKQIKIKPFTAFLIGIIFSLSSCITTKKINYLQEKSDHIATTDSVNIPQYKIRPGDNLYIKLSSLDPETALVLEPATQRVNSQNESERKYKDIYNVNNEGYVDIPQAGEIYVKDLTLEQIKDSVSFSISKYYKQINVQIRLADAYITILGEVNRPGRYLINFDDKISVFDLLGLAGDLTKYANRTNLKLVRKIGDKKDLQHIDLTDNKILEDESFYLMPNDIIYVEQLNAAFWDKSTFPFFSSLSVVLSTTTSILVILTYLHKP